MRANNAPVKYYVKLPDNGNVMYTIRSDRYIMSTKLSSTGVLSLRSFQKRQKTDQKPQIGGQEKSGFAQLRKLCNVYMKMVCVKIGVVKNYFTLLRFLLFSFSSFIFFMVSSLLRFCASVSFFFLTYLSVDVPIIYSSPH